MIDALLNGGLTLSKLLIYSAKNRYFDHSIMMRLTNTNTVPIGDAIVRTLDTAVGSETREELFAPLNPSTYQSLNGVEIILNSSTSHAELRKLKTRLDLISKLTRKLRGNYVSAASAT